MAEISSLSSLLKRLEAATTKLEDLAMAGASASNVSSSLTGSSGAHAPQGQLSQLAESAPAASQQDASHPHVEGFDELLNGPAKGYYDLSKTLGGLVEEQANYVRDLFAAQREMILVATLSQKPPLTSDVFRQLLEPTQKELMKVIEVRDKNRASPFANHLTAVADGIPALGWVAIEPKPAPYVAEMKDSAQFYANRVVKDWKEKDQNHVLWVRAYMDLLAELQNYVRKFHTTGLVWNPKGTPLDGNSLKRTSATPAAAPAAAAAPAPPAPSAGGPPPPPPPPPPMMLDTPAPVKNTAENDMSAVFAQLNQGEAITAGLRKVDKSKMTHKNPELRASGMVTSSPGKPGSPKRAGPGAPPKPASLTLKKPPKLALEGNKWVVENFENNNEVILDQVELNQSVYIYGCKNSTIQIKSKVTTIAMDSCTKTGLCVDSLISSLDLVNSKSVQVQILGRAPTVSLDKVDSCMVYLSKECLDVEILTSKCSAVNILTPETTEDGNDDFVERPVPEQFLTKIVDGKVITTAVEHSG
ncbi:MAG: adenylate cyclase associated N terminal-domain-containing protein [Linnemannia elongata]|nr:MAG: adenylate cyclase associated N terminal-domain-containing protein [Linnemannia elongata]